MVGFICLVQVGVNCGHGKPQKSHKSYQTFTTNHTCLNFNFNFNPFTNTKELPYAMPNIHTLPINPTLFNTLPHTFHSLIALSLLPKLNYWLDLGGVFWIGWIWIGWMDGWIIKPWIIRQTYLGVKVVLPIKSKRVLRRHLNTIFD